MDMSSIVCVRCGQNEHVPDAVYCQNCGIELLNYCTNEHCITHQGDEPCLPRYASYCPYCGSKTTYYDYLNESKNSKDSKDSRD